VTQVAAIQMASGPNISANLAEAERLIAKAAAAGARLVVLPENFALMCMNEFDKVKVREEKGKGQIQDFLARTASRYGIWLVGGTVPLVADDVSKVRAACLLFNDKGQCVAHYDKVHLFDVHLEESNEDYAESRTIEPGNKVVVIDTPFGRLGLSICYDLRFPELFRLMAQEGVEIIVLPAAFTAITGKAHWESMVRARAIENLSYFIASAQGGYHANGRETHGDSMIVDPWGIILDRLPRGSGFVMAAIEPSRLHAIRRNFPALEHRRLPCKLP